MQIEGIQQVSKMYGMAQQQEQDNKPVQQKTPPVDEKTEPSDQVVQLDLNKEGPGQFVNVEI